MPERPHAFESGDWLIAAALTLIVLVMGVCRMAPAVTGVYHDDAIYVATAKALSEGSGYRLIDLPGSPPQTKYPIGYPLMLSVLWTAWPSFPANLVLLQSFSLCCAGLSIGGAYLFVTRFVGGSRLARASAGLIAATATSTSYFASQTLSEAPFALATVAALWATAEAAYRGPTPFRDAVTGVTMAVPFLIRTLGAPGLAVSLWHLWSQKRLTRSMAVAAAAAAGSWVVWVAVAARLGDPGGSATRYYSVANYLGWWFQSSWQVPVLNMVSVAWAGVQLPTGSISDGIPWPVTAVVGAVIWATIVAAARAGDLLARTLTLYGVVVLFWPFPPRRFLVPFVFFLTLYSAQALSRFCRHWPSRRRAIAAAVVTTAIVVVNASDQYRIVRWVHKTGYPFSTPVPANLATWADYQSLFSWIQSNTLPDDVLASGLDSMIFMYTGRRAIRPFVTNPASLFYHVGSHPLGSPREFLERLAALNVTYVIELPMIDFLEMRPLSELIAAVRTASGSCLQEVYRLDADPRFAVYKTSLASCRAAAHSEP